MLPQVAQLPDTHAEQWQTELLVVPRSKRVYLAQELDQEGSRETGCTFLQKLATCIHTKTFDLEEIGKIVYKEIDGGGVLEIVVCDG